MVHIVIRLLKNGVAMLINKNRTGQGISYVFLTSYDVLVPLVPSKLFPLDLYLLEILHLKWTTLEGTPLELTHLWELGLDRSLIYI